VFSLQANVLDIESTVRHVCRKVLTDPSVEKPQRRIRARGLKELGRIFQAASPSGSLKSSRRTQDAEAAKQRIEAAMMQVMEKRHAADAMAHCEPPGQ
jgi:X-domain of DnaJ-containing